MRLDETKQVTNDESKALAQSIQGANPILNGSFPPLLFFIGSGLVDLTAIFSKRYPQLILAKLVLEAFLGFCQFFKVICTPAVVQY